MVVIDIEKKGAFQVRSVELVEVLDGQEIGRIPVDLTEEGQKAYAEALSKQSFAIPEPVSTVSASPDYQGHANFLYCLDKLYLIPRGSLLELFSWTSLTKTDFATGALPALAAAWPSPSRASATMSA